MANTKISALTAVTTLAGTDTFPIVQGTTPNLVTRKAAISDLLSFAPTGFRNLIHNGNFAVDQRANSTSHTFTSSSQYAIFIDRWLTNTTNSITGAVVAGSGASRFAYRLTSGNAAGNFSVGQRIESINVGHLAGTTVTLQVKLASPLLTSVTYTVSVPSSSVDTFGSFASPSKTTVVTGTFTVSATLTRQTVSFTLPSTATRGVEVMFTSSGLTNADTFTIADVQLEAGPIATTFETRPYQTELALCQRYINGFTTATYPANVTGTHVVGLGYSGTTTSTLIVIPFTVTLRRRPTGITTPSSYTGFTLYNGSYTGGAPTAIAFGSIVGLQQASVTVTTTAGTPTLVAGQGAYLDYNYTSAHMPILFTGAEMLV